MTSSPKPLVVDGVTIQPKWAWSPGYRAHVRSQLAEQGDSHLPASEIERRYAEWYAEQNGMSLDEALAVVRAARSASEGDSA